jgi:hypothetical protein
MSPKGKLSVVSVILLLAIVAISLRLSPGASAPIGLVDRRPSLAVDRPGVNPTGTVNKNDNTHVDAPKIRQRFQASKDYARFVAEIAPLAESGDPEAEYMTARALRWCAQTTKLYFIKPSGESRTLEDVQARWAGKPVGISADQLGLIYSRCRGFLESPESFGLTDTWKLWLDKAVAAKYPAALAQDAAITQSQLQIDPADSHPQEESAASAENRAKELALNAAASGDPDAIFLMSDWVRQNGHTEGEVTTLASAWKILACQKGYDCGPDSDWMISACSWDPQCANGLTYTDYLQRQLGSQYDDAVRLAKSIDDAITKKDNQSLRSFL